MKSRSHNTMQIVDAVIKAADQLDPVLINEFFALTIEANNAQIELLIGQVPMKDLSRQQEIICQGSLLLSLFNYFAGQKLRNRLSADQVGLG